jgi:hypothetical protein
MTIKFFKLAAELVTSKLAEILIFLSLKLMQTYMTERYQYSQQKWLKLQVC